jgi:regulator of replication initiation timing
MNNNIKLQVAKQLDENTRLKMKDEFLRLQAEEAARVQAYTKKWESHVDKLTKDKDAERI